LRNTLRLWWPATAWAALLLLLGSRPSEQLPSGGFWALPGIDKLAHVAFYGVFGFLVARAARPASGWGAAVVTGAVAGLIWGILDEWVQGQVPGRAREWTDLLADVIGAGGGAFVWARRPGHKTKRS